MHFDPKFILNLLTPGDKVLVMILIGLSLSSFAFFNIGGERGSIALITVQNITELRKNLDENETFVVNGPIGHTTIEIDNGAIRILDSNCPQKLCVRQGKIQNSGQFIVCVPNRILILIEGSRLRPFDVITG